VPGVPGVDPTDPPPPPDPPVLPLFPGIAVSPPPPPPPPIVVIVVNPAAGLTMFELEPFNPAFVLTVVPAPAPTVIV
jgi:hypothetical protein